MKYPKTRYKTQQKIKAFIIGLIAEDATKKITKFIHENYRRRKKT